MSRMLQQASVLAIPVSVLCLFVALIGAGCGWQITPTLGSVVIDGESTGPLADDPSDPDSDPVDQTPREDTETADPADPDSDPAPPPDDSPGEDVALDDDLPQNAYCEAVADWDDAWVAFENEVLELVNERRAAGADCGSGGTFEPAEPLTMNGALRCAARNHSMDMGVRDYFDHYSPDGVGPRERINQAGYSGSSWAENIAWGYSTPAAVVSGWMTSPGHCVNIMRAELTEIGVGYYEGSIWTQAFSRP